MGVKLKQTTTKRQRPAAPIPSSFPPTTTNRAAPSHQHTQHQKCKPLYTQIILSQMSQAQATNTANLCDSHTYCTNSNWKMCGSGSVQKRLLQLIYVCNLLHIQIQIGKCVEVAQCKRDSYNYYMCATYCTYNYRRL